MRNRHPKLYAILDVLLLMVLLPGAVPMKLFRRIGVHRLPLCKNALFRLGVFPLVNHYYEPQFDHRELAGGYAKDRSLPGIDWNVDGQLRMLGKFTHFGELAELEGRRLEGIPPFSYQNSLFSYGDADYWYQIIRAVKPKRIFEIGSGNSTIVARLALEMNREDDPDYACKHVCIEPFESPWLDGSGVTLIRKPVEHVGGEFFLELDEDDILFIDSSHIIRPQGDVLFEYLELLPSLKPGVIVHIHDIFSPKNYPEQWIARDVRFWNEQYLLEAFLSHNASWQVVGALNYLFHHHPNELGAVVPELSTERPPGSFYIRRKS
ncbi:MAG: class I SAM-dependent methyltransferase [Candidatus Hydrogenedentes bacterium]|nr:class I SAM-dependent methyltransferase [Candidatus Hydrogenedentota bacterium]